MCCNGGRRYRFRASHVLQRGASLPVWTTARAAMGFAAIALGHCACCDGCRRSRFGAAHALPWGSAPSVWGTAPAATADARVLAVCTRHASSIQVAREPACGDERSSGIICAPFTRGWARELMRLNHATPAVVEPKKRHRTKHIENEAHKVLLRCMRREFPARLTAMAARPCALVHRQQRACIQSWIMRSRAWRDRQTKVCPKGKRSAINAGM